MVERRKSGVTASEVYLGKLCDRSFLSIWSHPNLFTDRGTTKVNRQGKELCDLLVIFENHVVIFSDKSCTFPDTGDVSLDWRRWYKKAIKKSADQIYGAEKWILEHPDRIFLNNLCEHPFPYDIPSRDDIHIHRIAVALGAGRRAATHFGGGSSGSLMVFTNIEDGEDNQTDNEHSPFIVGHVNRKKGFVHVLDDHSLDIVMSELDTVSDFIAYLEAKEKFFCSSDNILCTGEEEFLGFYLDATQGEESFPPGKVQTALADSSHVVQIAEGNWSGYLEGKYAEFRKFNRDASKFYDALIEHFSKHLREGTLAYGSDEEYEVHERNLRYLAAEPRSHRAFVSISMAQKIDTTPANVRTSISIPSSYPDRMLVFLLFPRSIKVGDRKYREERHAAMDSYAYVIKYMNPQIRFVICLGVEPRAGRARRSEDLSSYDFSDWSTEDDVAAKRIQEEQSILVDIQPRQIWDQPNSRRGDLSEGNRLQRRRKEALKRNTKS